MSELSHKERTLQDIIDEMTPEQRELMDLVVGAAIADEVIEDDDIVEQALALPEEQRQLIDFIVGGYLAQQERASLEQSNLRVNDFLEHYGVKGMKWGVRRDDDTTGSDGVDGARISRSNQMRGRSATGSASKSQPRRPKLPKLAGNAQTVKLSNSTKNTSDERKAARKAVRRGKADLTDVHVAALKSTGHRVTNAFLGDKTYWKGAAVTAGIAGAVALSPAVLPAGVLGGIGAVVTGVSAGSTASVAAGGTVLTGAAALGAQISASVLHVKNVYRAVTGNSKIDESYARVGQTAIQDYRNGTSRTSKTVRRYGGLSGRKTKKALKQSNDLRVDSFLEHRLDVTLGQMRAGA